MKSDIVHQSVYELVHSEDREELQRQLMWNSFLPPESGNMPLQEVLQPDQAHLLERSFTVRFRCLLDNTSGFLVLMTITRSVPSVENIMVCVLLQRLDIRGRIKVLHGQNRKTEEPPLALFAICTPFGPPSLLEIPHKEVMFKSKHKLDLTLVSMDQRGKMLLGYTDSELANLGGYDLVHYDDLAYVASAHQELLKTGASGMIAYRYQTKSGEWQWLQTSSRLVYKNSKPDFVISTHRPLMEEEGRDLLGKRTMDFKVSYLDAGLTNSYFTDSEQLVSVGSPSPGAAPSAPAPQRVNRRYKTQLRDFLSTCRSKRKLAASHHTSAASPAVASAVVPSAMDYTDSSAAAVVAAYSNLNTMYTSPYGTVQQPDNGLTSYMGHSAAQFHPQTLYPAAAALDNRFLASTENLFHQYRPLGAYYTDYHTPTTPYVGNGFLDMSGRALYDAAPASHHHTHAQGKPSSGPEDKLYSCAQLVDAAAPVPKYAAVVEGGAARGYKCLDPISPYAVSPTGGAIIMTSSPTLMSGGGEMMPKASGRNSVSKHSPGGGMSASNSAGSSPANGLGAAPKLEDMKGEVHLLGSPVPPQYSPTGAGTPTDTPRQTVLMWGSGGTGPNRSPPPPETAAPVSTNGPYHAVGKKYGGVATDPLKSLAEMNSLHQHEPCKWAPQAKNETTSPSPPHPHPHPLPPSYGECGAASSEVWQYHHHQYYSYSTPYHHHAPQ
uniref:PAS fold-3 domain-containing protein n=1 Tax=Timema shepardi TaxID=629360 RepID=A0A7R9AX45_TIMSH|nr:unnamed protein product [Timema shepardi]